MDELKKIKRVIAKSEPGAPHEVLLVLDGNTGQNALSQLKAFDAALGVTGLVLTKLDGTAKGGVVAAIAKSQPVPPVHRRRRVSTTCGRSSLRSSRPRCWTNDRICRGHSVIRKP
jgi:hypothetical protein